MYFDLNVKADMDTDGSMFHIFRCREIGYKLSINMFAYNHFIDCQGITPQPQSGNCKKLKNITGRRASL